MKPVTVGEPAPDFDVVDFRGDAVKLSAYRGRSNVLIVLNRGLICPYCRKHLTELARRYDEFRRRNTEIIAVGADSAPAFERFWIAADIPFIGVPDTDRTVLRRYGQQVRLMRLGRLPAVVLVDREGIVRWVHYGGSMMDVPPTDEILRVLDEMAGSKA